MIGWDVDITDRPDVVGVTEDVCGFACSRQNAYM